MEGVHATLHFYVALILDVVINRLKTLLEMFVWPRETNQLEQYGFPS